MTFDPSTGTLSPVEEISALPSNFVGTNFTSEIRISQDGNFLYVANRLHDTIGIFQICPSGRLEHRGQVWTRGDYPRSFNIDPTGCYLYSCNHRGDSITIYSIQNGGDTLAFTKQYVAVGSPACIVFFTIP